jgi:plasmid stability protein
MAALSIRGLDDEVGRRLRVRAAQHGRSPERAENLFTALLVASVPSVALNELMRPPPAPDRHVPHRVILSP